MAHRAVVQAGLVRLNSTLKRAVDVSLALPALIAFAPLMVGIAAAIRVDSKGPALFRQKRYGRGAHVFEILKFRTMVQDAQVVIDPSNSRVVNREDDTNQTPIGRVLRRLSLDELPQLINVLKGDMSLVGPRPDLAVGLHWYSDYQLNKLKVRPGITGPAQVSGRNLLGSQEKWNLDAAYALDNSISVDLKILLATVLTVAKRRGVYGS